MENSKAPIDTNFLFYPVQRSTLTTSLFLMGKYDFQLFDSLIVASALEEGCDTLYSEDMQHDLLVEEQLKIVNPFIQLV